MKYLLPAITLFFAGPLPQTVCAATNEDLARSILARADEIRAPQEGYQVDVHISSTGAGKEREIRKYRILSKGNENTVVLITEPAADSGQVMLMKGRDLWIFMRSQPVRLALAQRLTGQVANGDLARSNFTGDYTPKILRTDTIEGKTYYVLELTAVDRGVTYHKVIYWVRQSNLWPHRAEFYSLSNRLLKTARYENFQSMLGKARPTRLVIEDGLRKGEESVLEYSGMQRRDLPDRFFTREYLQRLQ